MCSVGAKTQDFADFALLLTFPLLEITTGM